MRTLRRALAMLLAGALLVPAACGGGDRPEPRSPRTHAGAPADPRALARNAAQADRFIGASEADFERRLAALSGYPVVVNKWASWCPPCRAEVPYFHAATKRYRARVAFIGVDAADAREPAERFQRQVPSGYPSVFDENLDVTEALGGLGTWPQTIFLDRGGHVVYRKIGAYKDAAALAADIQRYALQSLEA